MTAEAKGRKKRWLLFVISASALILIFSKQYIRVEHHAYLWDWGQYWHVYQQYGKMISEADWSWLQSLQIQIANDDYNPSAIIPLMPAYAIFGGGRTAYIGAIAIIYLVPAAFAAAAIAGAFEKNELTQMWCISLALLFPVFWAPTIRGMVDIAGLIPLGIVTILVYNTEFLSRASAKQAVYIGFFIWLPFLLRRWYIFSIISLVVMSGIFAFLMTANSDNRTARLLRVVLVGGAACLIATILALLFQWPLIQRIVSTPYTDIYSAYQKNFAEQLLVYYHQFGFLCVSTIAVGLFAAARDIDARVLMCAGVATLSTLLFSHVQSPTVQHFLPVAFFLFPAFFKGAEWVARTLSIQFGKVLFTFIWGLNFVSTFVPITWGPAEFARQMFSESKSYPLHLDNYSEYKRLIKDLKSLPVGSKFSVFASSPTLSDSLLSALEPSITPMIVWSSQVDLRDHFDFGTLRADYVVIATPTPLHLNPLGQRVVTIPADQIRKNEGIGRAFYPLTAKYELDGHSIAQIYKRYRNVDSDDVKRLKDKFLNIYPQWRPYYDGNIALPLALSQVTLGDVWGTVSQKSRTGLLLHPGNTLPTSLRMQFETGFSPRGMELHVPGDLRRSCPDADGVEVEIFDQSHRIFVDKINPGETKQITILLSSNLLQIAVFPRQNSHCDHLYIDFTI